jgi:hypothetical protein
VKSEQKKFIIIFSNSVNFHKHISTWEKFFFPIIFFLLTLICESVVVFVFSKSVEKKTVKAVDFLNSNFQLITLKKKHENFFFWYKCNTIEIKSEECEKYWIRRRYSHFNYATNSYQELTIRCGPTKKHSFIFENLNLFVVFRENKFRFCGLAHSKYTTAPIKVCFCELSTSERMK